MRRNGIQARPKGPGRRWQVNEAYFSEVTTGEQAYWLGFLAADGNIIRKSDTGVDTGFRLQLKASDAGHLRKLAACLESDSPVHFFAKEEQKMTSAGKDHVIRGGDAAVVNFFSVRLAADLARYNIVHAKTLACRPWDAPPELAPHYWRGAVDGDGHVSAQGGVKLYGTEAMCEGFAAFARTVCDTRAVVRPVPEQRIWQFAIGGTRNIRSLLTALYGRGGIALDRKQRVADAWLAANPRMPAKAICTVCGAEYARSPKNIPQYYCGSACRTRAWQARSRSAA